MEKYLQQLLDLIIGFVGGLTPAALGALVSLAFEKGLTWSERFVQFAVGVIVSYYASNIAAALWPWQPMNSFVLQGISFVFGMCAFRATPKLIDGFASAVGNLPSAVADRALSWLPKKKGGE